MGKQLNKVYIIKAVCGEISQTKSNITESLAAA